MLKLTVGVLAFVLAGSASAAGWRSMRIDASSEDAFNESVRAFSDKLPQVRRIVFERSLQDIWVAGMKAAEGEGRDYEVGDYLREVDGLGYKQVVTFTDPTGKTADRYWDQAYTSINGGRNAPYRGPGRRLPGPNNSATSWSGSKILDPGQSARALGRIGGTHF